MTEAEWPDCEDPVRILHHLEGKVSGRRWRLMAAGCGRYVRHLLTDPRSGPAIDAAEAFADGVIDAQQLAAAHAEAVQAAQEVLRAEAHAAASAAAAAESFHPMQAVWLAAWALVRSRVEDVSTQIVAREAAESAARKELAALLRDVAGNPFRAAAVEPAWTSWGDGTVKRLAEAAYGDRAFDRLPIIADALEDAGCSDPVILTHLRGTGPHVRGCWAVDLLLGRR
jgi:hypothetical protein